MKNLRNQFPILSQYTYLNTAASGILYDDLLEYRQHQDLDFLIKGSEYRATYSSVLTDLKNRLAHHFKVSKGDVVLCQNFSLAINILASGFQKNKRVLLIKEDYPSLNFAFESKGFDVHYLSLGAQFEDKILAYLEQNPIDIFAFSIVQYTNGLLINLDFIKKLKQRFPNILLIADATQFFGIQAFDFSTSGIDIIGASGYKWLLSGYGNGFLLFNSETLEQTTPESYKKNAKKAVYDPSYINLQARFEPGHQDLLCFGSLNHSLKFLYEDVGISEINLSIKKISDYAQTQFASLELLEPYLLDRKQHSSIYNLKGDEALYQKLKENTVLTALRGNGIRVSLHFYNTEDDIDHLIQILRSYS